MKTVVASSLALTACLALTPPPPAVRGPGAVASVGCAEATGTITLAMAPMIGHDSIGRGKFDYELWSKRLSEREQLALEHDKQRQITEQQQFAAEEDRKQRERAIMGCSK